MLHIPEDSFTYATPHLNVPNTHQQRNIPDHIPDAHEEHLELYDLDFVALDGNLGQVVSILYSSRSTVVQRLSVGLQGKGVRVCGLSRRGKMSLRGRKEVASSRAVVVHGRGVRLIPPAPLSIMFFVSFVMILFAS